MVNVTTAVVTQTTLALATLLMNSTTKEPTTRASTTYRPNRTTTTELDMSLFFPDYQDDSSGSGSGDEVDTGSQAEMDDDNVTSDDGTSSGRSSSGRKRRKKDKKVGNSTKDEVAEKLCEKGKFQYSEESINWIILLTIAAAFVVFITFNQRRSGLCPGLLGGRPGFLSPFPITDLGRHRLTYIAFWAMVAYDGIQIIIGGKANLFIPTTCVSKWEAPIVVLINIHIFAILYFPIIGAMSTDTPLGYMISTTWIWAISVVRGFDIAKDFNDDGQSKSRFSMGTGSETTLTAFISAIPAISMLYLCFIFPFRLLKGLYLFFVGKRTSAYHQITPPEPYANTAEGLYVRELLRPPQPPPERKGFKKILNFVEKIYKNKPYFRYSQNILSAMVIGLIFVYFIALLDINYLVTVSSAVPVVVSIVEGMLRVFFDNPLAEKILMKTMKSNDTTVLEKKVDNIINIAEAHIYCIFYSNVAALILVFIIQLYLNVTMLQAYRDDRLRAQQGVYVVLSPPVGKARGTIGGAVRYMGFQAVIYAWAIIIQLLIFTFIGTIVGFAIVIPLAYGYGDVILRFIITLLPALGVTIGLSIVIQLTVAYCFTAVPCGTILAVNNPRGYSNYAYISFFKSLFVGLVSAVLRVIFSVVVGAIFFSRLDMPTVTPKFKMLDTGFKQYESLIHLENAHMHPVLVTFVNMCCDRIRSQAAERKRIRARLEREAAQHQPSRTHHQEIVHHRGALGETSPVAVIESIVDDEYVRMIEVDRKRRCIRFKWLLLRTLVCNPKVGIERKMALNIDQFQKRQPFVKAA